MGVATYEAQANVPSPRYHHVRMVGTGAAAPTKQVGQGITITRTAVGVYRLTWAENPGIFVGLNDGLQAVTPGDIKNHSLVWDTYDAATRSIEVTLWDAAAAAHDLAANEFIHAMIVFAESGPVQ